MAHESFADRFISLMGLLNSIEPDSDAPERFIVWQQKQLAENIIDDALRRAREAAYFAKSMQKEVRGLMNEAADAARTTNPEQADTGEKR